MISDIEPILTNARGEHGFASFCLEHGLAFLGWKGASSRVDRRPKPSLCTNAWVTQSGARASHPLLSRAAVSILLGFSFATWGCNQTTSTPLFFSFLELHEDAFLKLYVVCFMGKRDQA